MKFAVCSLAIGSDYKETIRGCIQSHEAHALKHGYDRINDAHELLGLDFYRTSS